MLIRSTVREWSDTKYSIIHKTTNFGSMFMCLFSIFVLKSWALWGLFFAIQIIGCHWLGRLRYGKF